jgi:DNA mismatch repair ATPase MutS
MNFTGEWEGSYCGNNYQMVTDEDARALGEALLRAVAALAAREQDWVQQRRQDCQDEIEFISPAQEFAAKLECLHRLANYALKGGFVIA